MSGGSHGPLLAADEGFTHQVVDTFASVGCADLDWTEKVCGMVAARDGSLQVGFGFGKYTNRNVVDAYGGASRGVEQWTVRASRRLSSAVDTVDAGPLRYQVLEPLQRVRVQCLPNAAQPLSYDLELVGAVPCRLEEREDRRTPEGYRHTANQLRYHQTGTVQGWIELEGVRHEVTPEKWVMTRDHSWGIRPAVGVPPGDLPPQRGEGRDMDVLAVWNPLLFQRADGSHYAFHQYLLRYRAPGFRHERVQGAFEYPDGSIELVRDLIPELRFDATNQRLLGGRVRVLLAGGVERVITLRPLQGTGFHLGAGLYHGFDGQYHGSWRGDDHLAGEYFADCSTPGAVARLNQFRDCCVEAVDESTGAVGWGNCQTWVSGNP